MPFGIPASILGLIVKGDLAGQTIYTDRHMRKIWFPQAPPLEPASPLQLAQRDRFRQAQANYMALSVQAKLDYENAVKATSLCLTGQNLYIHLSLKCDPALLATIERQAGLTLITPPCIPWP